MKRVILLSFTLLLVAGGRTLSKTLHVPGQYGSIQQAINHCDHGDTVVVAAGRYYETINFDGRDIIVTSEHPDDPDVVAATIIDADLKSSAVTFRNGETSSAVLTGFTITNGYGTAVGTEELPEELLWGGGVFCYQSSPTIKGNVIVNNHGPVKITIDPDGTPTLIALGYGVGIACVESNAVVTNNIIRDNSGYAGGAIMTVLADARFSNNLIYGNKAWVGGGVVLLGGSQLIGNTITSNNAFIDFEPYVHIPGMVGNLYAVTEPGLGQALILNNIICNAVNGGGVFLEGPVNLEHFTYNNVWGNAQGNYVEIDPETGAVVEIPGQTGKNGNISVDPMFVSPLSHDYHLRQGSGCINAGDLLYVPPPGQTDIDGQPRVMLGRVDIGADEYFRISYVDTDATGENNGSSWEDAYNYLQDALMGAAGGTEVRVAQGIYRPDEFVLSLRPNLGRMETFALKNGVTLKGGYAGFGEPDPDARDITEYQTILSGDLDVNDVDVSELWDLIDEPTRAENTYHVVTGSGTDDTAILDGFTVTAGNADGDREKDQDDGAGMYNSSGSPTVTNCTFSGNSADGGGGMYNENSSPTITGCTFSGNSVPFFGSDGGGMFNYHYSSPTVNNCTFSENCGGGMVNWNHSNSSISNCTFSGNSSAGSGGGMNNHYSSATVSNCTFSANSAHNGGGMGNYGCSPTVEGCTFTGNSAYDGGGMCNEESSPTVSNCTFSGNSSNDGGGMYNGPRSNAKVEGCAFSGNSASKGGGMCNHKNSIPITNCTFTGNSAYFGGGMYNYHSSRTTITNCTIGDNSASNGPAVACNSYRQSYPCTVTMVNCIVWNGSDWLWNNDSSTIDVNYSDVEGGWPDVGNIDADPCFVDSDANDYHLLPDSPCINAGDPAGDYSGQTDMDGESRVMLGRVDMGADEFNPFEARFVVVNKERIDRTIFEYDCVVVLENVSRFAVRNVRLELVKASENMTLIEPNVRFGDIVIGPGLSAAGNDTCTFRVDRAQLIEPAEIIWWSACRIAGDGGPTMEHTASSLVFLEPPDCGEGEVDYEELAELARLWLWKGRPGSIPEDTIKDGTINLADFAELAGKWKK